MNYSPIIVPVIAFAIWSLLSWVMYIPPTLRLIFADDFDPPLTEEERRRAAERQSDLNHSLRMEWPMFYVLCIALAYMGAGSGLASWLAWACAGGWAIFKLPQNSLNTHLRCGAAAIANASMWALAIYAGFVVTRDLLAAYG